MGQAKENPTSPAHTPTPWIIKGFDLWISAGDGKTQICDLVTDYQKDYGRKFTKKERAANARLIAAAPKLLEAAKENMDFLPSNARSKKLFDAIAKAQGR